MEEATKTEEIPEGEPKGEPKAEAGPAEAPPEAPPKEKSVYVCNVCQKVFASEHAVRTHVAMVHKPEGERGEEEKPPEKPEIKRPAPEEEMFKEMAEVLRFEAGNTPGIGAGSLEYIMRQFERREKYRLDPMQLFTLILSTAPKAKPEHVGAVVEAVFDVAREYGLDQVRILRGLPPLGIPRRGPWTFSPYAPYAEQPPFTWQPTYGVPWQPMYGGPIPERAEKEEKEERTPYVLDGVELMLTPKEILAYKQFESQREEARQRDKEFQAKLAEMSKPAAPPKAEESEVVKSLSAQVSNLQQELSKVREESFKAQQDTLQRQLDAQAEDIRTLRAQLTPEAIAKQAETLGLKQYKPGGMTGIDLVDSSIDKLSAAIDRGGARIERVLTRGAEFAPEFKYSPAEREAKAREIERRIEREARLSEAEHRLVQAVRS